MDKWRALRGLPDRHKEAYLISLQHEPELDADAETVGKDEIGLGKLEYKATIGSSKTEYKDAVGLDSKMKYDKVSEGDETIGHCNETAYDKIPADVEDKNGEDLVDLGVSPDELRERAKAGIRRRKAANKPLKKKLYGMANHLHQVMLTCAFVAGTMACEQVVQPGIDLCTQMGHRVFGEPEEKPACLEIFAGSANISSAFARARCGVLRPVDSVFGDDLRKEEVREQVFTQVEHERPR